MSSQRKRVSKVLLLGDSFVGKSSLIQRFVNKQFSQQFRATIGCDFLMKEIRTEDGIMNLQLWDTAGQERFESLGRAFYRGSDGLILVFDITNNASFLSLAARRDDFMDLANVHDPDNFPVVVVANKTDREADRTVKMEDVKKWVGQFPGTRLFECSAKEGTGVAEAFEDLTGMIIRREAAAPVVIGPGTTKIVIQGKKDKAKTCC